MASEDTTWGELLGCNDWEGLLDRLDQSLRKLILRCSYFCQVVHDAFDNDPYSKYCGFSRYGKKLFLEKALVENASVFDVVPYIYGSARVSTMETYFVWLKCREAWDRESNWIGFITETRDDVSGSLDRREIYVVWRGTRRSYEWVNELVAKLVDESHPALPDLDAGIRPCWDQAEGRHEEVDAPRCTLRSLWDWHNLRGILHVVAWRNGEKGEFELKAKRSGASRKLHQGRVPCPGVLVGSEERRGWSEGRTENGRWTGRSDNQVPI